MVWWAWWKVSAYNKALVDVCGVVEDHDYE